MDPAYRDTATVPQGGWVLFRFLADNRGLWLLHCHIFWHQFMGQAIAFAEGTSRVRPVRVHQPLYSPTKSTSRLLSCGFEWGSHLKPAPDCSPHMFTLCAPALLALQLHSPAPLLRCGAAGPGRDGPGLNPYNRSPCSILHAAAAAAGRPARVPGLVPRSVRPLAPGVRPEEVPGLAL